VADAGRQRELGLGVDGDELGLGRGGSGDVRGPAGAELEDAPGLRVAQQGVQQLGVARPVEGVVEPERRRDGEGGDVDRSASRTNAACAARSKRTPGRSMRRLQLGSLASGTSASGE
jgi:hypothetical protein